jgi:hypothetical protein
MTLCEAIGVSGFAISACIYITTLKGYLSFKSIWYPALNLLSTIMLSVALIDQWSLTGALMSAMFGTLSVYGLYQNWKHYG